MRLDGKIALVTGGGSGIGEAACELFAEEGASVAVSDVNLVTARLVADDINDAGGVAVAIAGDVSQKPDAESIVRETVKRFGRIDILVNSAGVTSRQAPEDADFDERWDFVINVNLKGTMLMSRFATDEMKKTGGGAVVNLSSIYGLVGRPADLTDGFEPYTASKGGVLQLTREMGVGLAQYGIRANCLCPGFVHTNLTRGLTQNREILARLESLTPMGRLAEADEIAKAILFLASDDASYITGAALSIDGGYAAQ